MEHEVDDFFQTSSLQLTFYRILLCSAVSRMQISTSRFSCSSFSSTLGSALGLTIDVTPEPDFTWSSSSLLDNSDATNWPIGFKTEGSRFARSGNLATLQLHAQPHVLRFWRWDDPSTRVIEDHAPHLRISARFWKGQHGVRQQFAVRKQVGYWPSVPISTPSTSHRLRGEMRCMVPSVVGVARRQMPFPYAAVNYRSYRVASRFTFAFSRPPSNETPLTPAGGLGIQAIKTGDQLLPHHCPNRSTVLILPQRFGFRPIPSHPPCPLLTRSCTGNLYLQSVNCTTFFCLVHFGANAALYKYSDGQDRPVPCIDVAGCISQITVQNLTGWRAVSARPDCRCSPPHTSILMSSSPSPSHFTESPIFMRTKRLDLMAHGSRASRGSFIHEVTRISRSIPCLNEVTFILILDWLTRRLSSAIVNARYARIRIYLIPPSFWVFTLHSPAYSPLSSIHSILIRLSHCNQSSQIFYLLVYRRSILTIHLSLPLEISSIRIFTLELNLTPTRGRSVLAVPIFKANTVCYVLMKAPMPALTSEMRRTAFDRGLPASAQIQPVRHEQAELLNLYLLASSKCPGSICQFSGFRAGRKSCHLAPLRFASPRALSHPEKMHVLMRRGLSNVGQLLSFENQLSQIVIRLPRFWSKRAAPSRRSARDSPARLGTWAINTTVDMLSSDIILGFSRTIVRYFSQIPGERSLPSIPNTITKTVVKPNSSTAKDKTLWAVNNEDDDEGPHDGRPPATTPRTNSSGNSRKRRDASYLISQNSVPSSSNPLPNFNLGHAAQSMISPQRPTGTTLAGSSKHVDEPPVSGHRIPAQGSFVCRPKCVFRRDAPAERKVHAFDYAKVVLVGMRNCVQTGFPTISNQPAGDLDQVFGNHFVVVCFQSELTEYSRRFPKKTPAVWIEGQTRQCNGSACLVNSFESNTKVTPNRGCENFEALSTPRMICPIHQPRGRGPLGKFFDVRFPYPPGLSGFKSLVSSDRLSPWKFIGCLAAWPFSNNLPDPNRR
ncbi:uncharacterized protein CLUP02_13497 [Colletotrichum lupini]|uniref:Uncharacterized protein n=1 Tax=Colletotrichum lupini TaxID=145971 RepID=A0A9Q8T2H8_9PEZI|nr:uncharacterized protein CLUP02_13497 [Colletotrichum lupini]UQC87976.1 hypothetical protein CLUP02_13497 [Colletotrichum lupini]